MFKIFKTFLRDRHAVIALHAGAQKQAHLNGVEQPGAEHFLLSALELPDGTAKQAFKNIGIDPDSIRPAIIQQYNDALNSIGMDALELNFDNSNINTVCKNRLFPNSANYSGRLLVKSISKIHQDNFDIPLVGAHIVIAITYMDSGVIARTLRAMNVDKVALHAEAQKQLNLYLPAEKIV